MIAQQDIDRMCALYRAGKTQAEIAEFFPVTRQRIQQCLRSRGLGRISGGAAHRSTERLERRMEGIEARCRTRWGMSTSERNAVRAAYGRKPFRAFKEQRINARNRGIAFDLTFAQWWAIWTASGKWSSRGKAYDRYVMTRPGDQGGYTVGNVIIKTLRENFTEHHARRRARASVD
jgi:hypothetical protein